MEIKRDSLEAKILNLMLEKYPITLKELRDELNIKEGVLLEGLKKLQLKRAVELEILPDTVFIRLLRTDLSFVGINATQKKALKRKLMKFNENNKEEADSVMYI